MDGLAVLTGMTMTVQLLLIAFEDQIYTYLGGLPSEHWIKKTK